VTTRLAGSMLAAILTGCSGEGPAQPEPTPVPPVTPGPASGPTTLVFVSADPVPGSSVSGCGADIAGCAGRVRMVFELRPSQSGFALAFKAFLHATNKQACLLTSTHSFPMRAGERTRVEVVFDQSDRCATPVTIANMAAVLEGTVEVASRQEWSLQYTFLQ
jgi:hypothetical protein